MSSSAAADAKKLQSRWEELCRRLEVSPADTAKWWQTLETRHGEPQRFYHTLSHLAEMFGYFDEHTASIEDAASVGLAIFFHDVIYNPRAGSPQNEKDSADLFDIFAQEALPAGAPPGHQKGLLASKVRRWIEQTAHHKCADGDEMDCRLFMDFDMAVLGRPWEQYEEYSRQIRQEYCHVPEAVFCLARSAFLKSAAADLSLPIYATDAFRDSRESQARANAAKEAQLLSEQFERCSLLARLTATAGLRLQKFAKNGWVARCGAGSALALGAAAAPSACVMGIGLPLASLLGYFGICLGTSSYLRQPLAPPAVREQGLTVTAGSYNPPHNGHLEVVRYLAARYERVHMVIGVNPSKTYAVSPYVRQELLRAMLKELGLANVEVFIVYSYLWKHAQKHGAKVMYRGIRSLQKDGLDEKKLEFLNLAGQLILAGRRPIPTAYIQADPRFLHVSSTLLRQRLQDRETIADLVPPGCASLVQEAYG
ncbi:coaD [Symbiodinium sp. CCMP2592]|nr:coaD [Symbiodinium sp. CCMP2592]